MLLAPTLRPVQAPSRRIPSAQAVHVLSHNTEGMKTYFSGLLPRKPAGEGPSEADSYVLSLITLADVLQTRSADMFS